MKLSLILMCWNTSHLLARTLETLKKQTLDEWELLIIDDMSEDDVSGTLKAAGFLGMNCHSARVYRLEHAMGMRGNTVSINYGLRKAMGNVVMWSTPEVMLPPGALKAMYNMHRSRPTEKLWVTISSHGLTAPLQRRIDMIDWQSDLDNLKQLVADKPPDHWDSVWFHLNYYPDGRRDGPSKKEIGKEFGNNQTVSVVRSTWVNNIGTFPYFLDYGSDDPWVADARRMKGYVDVTLWGQEAYHQWHTTSQYWIAKGKAPYWNKGGHTIDNLLGDPEVPPGGTCEIWDGGNRDTFNALDRSRLIAEREPDVIATGFKAKE